MCREKQWTRDLACPEVKIAFPVQRDKALHDIPAVGPRDLSSSNLRSKHSLARQSTSRLVGFEAEISHANCIVFANFA